MTEKQRKMVADNHNLIYSFLYTYGYDINEFYDLAAIGLCKAAKKWNESRGLFSKFAYICMKSEIDHYFTMQKYQKRIPECMIFSYDVEKYDDSSKDKGEIGDFLNILANDKHFEDEIILDLYIKNIKKRLNKREILVFELSLEGYSNRQIGKIIGYSGTTIDTIKKQLRETLIDILEDLR